TVTANNVFNAYGLGIGDGSSGTYSLIAGVLSVSNTEFVGNAGPGVFNQSGGSHTIGFNNGSTGGELYVGGFSVGSGGSGSFSLSAGSLAVSKAEYVGFGGPGVFTQTGGNHSIGTALVIAANAGSSGTVNLSGGSLTAAST